MVLKPFLLHDFTLLCSLFLRDSATSVSIDSSILSISNKALSILLDLTVEMGTTHFRFPEAEILVEDFMFVLANKTEKNMRIGRKKKKKKHFSSCRT